MRSIALCITACSAALLLSACSVGPDYSRPTVDTPKQYKELQGWKVATPQASVSDGQWWKAYGDPVLDDLEAQVEVSNQNLKAAEAAYRESQALVDQARASYFPQLTLGLTGQRGKGGTGATSTQPSNQFALSLGASWVPDVWGRIRRTVESDVAQAQASVADLAAARLSAQVALATDYFELRTDDEEKQMLDETVKAYQESLRITQNQYAAGIVSAADVSSAQTQLLGADTQDINSALERALLEHAIAVLAGKPPAKLDIQTLPTGSGLDVPVMPTDEPSTLLERRPDIVAAERLMASANAQIGVAVSAYYPDLTLSASDGYEHSILSGIISAPNRVWEVGADIAVTVLDFGAHSAQVRQARAAYDLQVADYRQTVLSAFQQVEDELATLHYLQQEADSQEAAVKAAQESTRITRNQYLAGIVAYTSVVVAETSELSAEQTAFAIRAQRLAASAALIEALGGGWDASQAMQLKDESAQ